MASPNRFEAVPCGGHEKWNRRRDTMKVNDNRNEKRKKTHTGRQTVNENGEKREWKWDGKWTHSMYTIFSVVIKLYFMIWHVIFFYCDISIPCETMRAHTHTSTVTIEHVYYDPIQHSKKLSHIVRRKPLPHTHQPTNNLWCVRFRWRINKRTQHNNNVRIDAIRSACSTRCWNLVLAKRFHLCACLCVSICVTMQHLTSKIHSRQTEKQAMLW